jgi:hypothetical protein
MVSAVPPPGWGLALSDSRRHFVLGIAVLLAMPHMLLLAQQRRVEKPSSLKVVEVKEPDGQILSYRHLAGSTEIRMHGTKLAPEARVRLKVGTRPGFTEIDINRGDITNLKPAQQFGKDFLTYVLWAVSVDGKASNLGEITFEREHPISINVTTPYQTFWLMLTAEPDFAVVDPSPLVVLYSVGQGATGEPSGSKPLPIKSDLFFFTHYTAYDAARGGSNGGPNDLLQARKAVELATKSEILATTARAGASRDGERVRRTLEQAKGVLAQAEDAHRNDPQAREVVQFARSASQIAENARALAGGAVGDALSRRLEDELATLRSEFDKLQSDSSKLRAELAAAREEPGPKSSAKAEPAKAQPVETKPQETPAVPAAPLAKPIVWFGVLGWVLALLLLFRRRGM